MNKRKRKSLLELLKQEFQNILHWSGENRWPVFSIFVFVSLLTLAAAKSLGDKEFFLFFTKRKYLWLLALPCATAILLLRPKKQSVRTKSILFWAGAFVIFYNSVLGFAPFEIKTWRNNLTKFPLPFVDSRVLWKTLTGIYEKKWKTGVETYNEGVGQAKLGQAKKALKSYDAALLINPGFYSTYINLASLALNDGDCQRALRTLLKGEAKIAKAGTEKIFVSPDGEAKFYDLIGTVYKYCDGDLQKKLAYALKAVDLAPKNSMVLGNLGLTYYSLERYQEAIDAFLKVLEFTPKHKHSLINLGQTYTIIGDYEQAEYYTRRALEVLESKDWQQYETEQTDEVNKDIALEVLAQGNLGIVEESNLEALAHNNLGNILGLKGDVEGAIAEFEAALVLEPNFSLAKRNLEKYMKLRR